MTATSEVRLFLAELVTLEQSLAIADPEVISGCTAFTYFPRPDQDMDDRATWINEVTLNRQMRGQGDRHSWYTVRTQLLVKGDDKPAALACAWEFFEAFQLAIEADLKLGGTLCASVQIEGAQPTATILTWNGKDYGGLDLRLLVQTEKTVTLLAPSS